MEDNKVLDLREGEEIHISYTDDDGQTITGFAILIEISPLLIKFKTNQNIICIPSSRLIKIKQRLK